MFSAGNTTVIRLPYADENMLSRFDTIWEHDTQTDRQTDIQTDRRNCYIKSRVIFAVLAPDYRRRCQFY